MIVVADTSVILNLCRVQHEHLLQQLFKRVLIPAEVADEFTRQNKIHARFSGLVLPGWIEISSRPQTLPPEVIQAQLDIGESAAIALCLNQTADVLLIDEKAGREVATRLGIRTVGIAGVLIDAKMRSWFQRESFAELLGKRSQFLDFVRITPSSSATGRGIISCSLTK